MAHMTVWTWPKRGETAWFYGGNGFPLGFYEPLMRRLSHRFSLHGMHNRACWRDAGVPTRRDGWRRYGADLAHAVRAEGQGGVIGIGHSMGACAMVLAARANPGLFRALILVEPAMVSRRAILMSRLIPQWAGGLVKPVRAARGRPECFADVDAYLGALKPLPAYRRFGDESWQAVAKHGLRPVEQGLTLAFPRVWEAHNFFHAEAVLPDLCALDIPVAVIRARASYFFPDPLWQALGRIRPDVVRLEDARFGHLLPIEAPEAAAGLIDKALSALDSG